MTRALLGFLALLLAVAVSVACILAAFVLATLHALLRLT